MLLGGLQQCIYTHIFSGGSECNNVWFMHPNIKSTSKIMVLQVKEFLSFFMREMRPYQIRLDVDD